MNKMHELVEELNRASYAYYALDKPIMSDKEYDKLYDELEALEKKTGVILAGSPTQKVQGFLLNGFNKVVHSKPMLSAAKSKNIEDVRKFLGDNEWYCSGKLDGCFPKQARVKMADGTEKKIVDVKVGDYVASYNEITNEIEAKRVINVFENGRKPSDDWIRIKLHTKNYLNNDYYLKCTKNHKILTTLGWRKAEELEVGDYVYRYGYVLSHSQNDFLIGIGLGDGALVKKQQHCNSISNIECFYSKVNKYPYNSMIDKSIELFDFNNPKLTYRKSGYGSDMIDINLHTVCNRILANDDNLIRTSLTFTQEVLDQLTPLSLAILYIDDGSRCTSRDDGYDCAVNKQVRCRIAVNRHPRVYVDAFSKWLSEHGYYNRVFFEKNVISDNDSSGCFLEMNVEGTRNFFNAIAPYVPKELRYIKLGLKECWQDCEEIKWWQDKGKCGVIEGRVADVTEGLLDRPVFKRIRNRKPLGYQSYDLEVEDNHTYFVNNFVVHNCTLVLRFSGGKLVQGITRGDGTVGEDVTEACRFIKNIPIQIPYEDDLEVRGECVMSWDEFNRVNETLTEKYSHPRNLAAGTLRQFDLNIVKERGLSFVAFECVTPLTDSKAEDLHWLHFYQGFETVIRRVSYEHAPYTDNYLRGVDETLEQTVDYMTLATKTDKYPYDGLVFEIDSRKVSNRLGTTAHHPNCRFALKWADETKETVLRDVEWNVGKTGVLFPTAVVDPVDLDGAITQKATLNNVSYIKDLELGIGDTVTIYRSNQVIPCLDDNLTRSNTLELPKVCPECGSPVKLVKENDSEMLYCTNPNCKGILLGKLKHFVSRAGLNIEGLSEQTLKTLVNMGAVDSFEDIFKLKTWKVRLSSVPGFGAKSIDKLLKSIDEASQHVDLAHFISALSIAGIGLAQGKVLAQTFGTWAKFYECATNKYDFTSIDGIGSVLSRNIHKYFAQNKDIDMLTAYITFADDEPKKSEDDAKLKGLTFVVTGKVYSFKNRNELSDKIQSLGGHVASSVTAKTNFLINNDATSGSTKNKKAHELGVKIITEDEFLEMIR